MLGLPADLSCRNDLDERTRVGEGDRHHSLADGRAPPVAVETEGDPAVADGRQRFAVWTVLSPVDVMAGGEQPGRQDLLDTVGS
jgi:hypothetical protein